MRLVGERILQSRGFGRFNEDEEAAREGSECDPEGKRVMVHPEYWRGWVGSDEDLIKTRLKPIRGQFWNPFRPILYPSIQISAA